MWHFTDTRDVSDLPVNGARIPALLTHLEELSFLHRATAHVLAGWSPKIPELHVKAAAARHAFEDLDTAQRLARHGWALTRGWSPGHVPAVSTGTVELMRAVDSAPGPSEVVVAIYGVIKRHMITLAGELLRGISPVLDATLLYVLPQALELLERQAAWASRMIAGGLPVEAALFAAKIEQLFEHRRRGAPVPMDSALWGPLDRVPYAARPAGMRRGVPGAMRPLPLDSSRDRAGIGLFLHNLIHGEYTTLELASRSLYEHPELPPAFQLQLARQASDEARHARAIEDAAREYGVSYGDYPIYTLTYDGYYQFAPVEPGSKRELAWRLLVRGTIDEGLALDDFLYQTRRREHLGQPELAELFRYLLADELFHAQAALQGSRQLLGGEEPAIAERELVNREVSRMLDHRRREFVLAHPEEAARELEHRREVEVAESRYPLPFDRVMNLEARREAGFSDRDLEQIVGFGYAMPLRFAAGTHDPDQ